MDTTKDKIEYFAYIYGTSIEKLEKELHIRRGYIVKDNGALLSKDELEALANRFKTTVEWLTEF